MAVNLSKVDLLTTLSLDELVERKAFVNKCYYNLYHEKDSNETKVGRSPGCNKFGCSYGDIEHTICHILFPKESPGNE